MRTREITTIERCQTCEGELFGGPLGWQCPRCLLALAAAAEEAGEVDIEKSFPELRIEKRIARGGFGTVFRAEHRRMKRLVALKFLDRVLAHAPEAVALFEREMVSVASLDHPGIVRAYDAGERDGHWYLVMELVDGEDCGALAIRHGQLPVAESCEIIRQAALALHHAHSRGLVHRDVKPGNLMVTRGAKPLVKVLDFGLARVEVEPFIEHSKEEEEQDGQRFLGTLEYVAPEQIEAPEKVDARADIYALGATLRRMLTGLPAREGMSEQSLAMRRKAITSTPVEPIAALRPDLPPKLAAICDQLLALDRERRPASAEQVAKLLEPWCRGAELIRVFGAGPLAELPFFKVERRRRWWWAAAVGGLVWAGSALEWPLVKPTPLVPAREGKPGVRLFTEELARQRGISPTAIPRLLVPEWEPERTLISSLPAINPIARARLRPDGRIIYIQQQDWIYGEETPGGECRPVFGRGLVSGCESLGVQPETGNFVWARHHDPGDAVILRYLANGTPLPPLAPDFSSEAGPESRAAMRAWRFAKGDKAGCAYPWGFAFVTEGQVPPESGLRPGDVLYADEGHRDLSLSPKAETQPGIWKFRFDSEEPAQRFGALPAAWVKGQTYFPVDVTVSRLGVFLLNRPELVAKDAVTEADFQQCLFRWEKGGFRPCVTDQAVRGPVALAADPLSSDLYVLDGGMLAEDGVTLPRRLLRLRSTGGDHYRVEVAAEGFAALDYLGLQITADGQRMLITDKGHAAAIVLRRREK